MQKFYKKFFNLPTTNNKTIDKYFNMLYIYIASKVFDNNK